MTENVVIPKIIMQTWKNTILPEKWQPTQISIQTHMNEWKYVLMTDEMNRQFIIDHFPLFLETYDNFPYPIQRADAIRYAWLYVNGGLYLDCDFELLAPLDELFVENYDLFLVTSANTPSVITNGFMAAKPENPLWLEMMNEMSKPPGIYNIEKHLLVMNTTGPLALNRVVKRLNLKANQDYKLLETEKINPYTLCDHEYDNPNALLKPLEGSSWVSGFGNVCQWCYCNSTGLIVFLIFLFLIILILVLLYYLR